MGPMGVIKRVGVLLPRVWLHDLSTSKAKSVTSLKLATSFNDDQTLWKSTRAHADGTRPTHLCGVAIHLNDQLCLQRWRHDG